MVNFESEILNLKYQKPPVLQGFFNWFISYFHFSRSFDHRHHTSFSCHSTFYRACYLFDHSGHIFFFARAHIRGPILTDRFSLPVREDSDLDKFCNQDIALLDMVLDTDNLGDIFHRDMDKASLGKDNAT